MYRVQCNRSGIAETHFTNYQSRNIKKNNILSINGLKPWCFDFGSKIINSNNPWRAPTFTGFLDNSSNLGGETRCYLLISTGIEVDTISSISTSAKPRVAVYYNNRRCRRWLRWYPASYCIVECFGIYLLAWGDFCNLVVSKVICVSFYCRTMIGTRLSLLLTITFIPDLLARILSTNLENAATTLAGDPPKVCQCS